LNSVRFEGFIYIFEEIGVNLSRIVLIVKFN
jgi:hypothetical protein